MMYTVGDVYPQFVGGDGLFLSYDADGLVLLCRMGDPTDKEKRAFNAGQPLGISMGSIGCAVYWTVSFGDIPMMDCTYSPKIGSAPVFPDRIGDGEGILLTVMLADALTGELLNLRAVGLPHDFSVRFVEEVKLAAKSSMPYDESINRIYRHSTEALNAKANTSCQAV